MDSRNTMEGTCQPMPSSLIEEIHDQISRINDALIDLHNTADAIVGPSALAISGTKAEAEPAGRLPQARSRLNSTLDRVRELRDRLGVL